jgi:hypothetical protein
MLDVTAISTHNRAVALRALPGNNWRSILRNVRTFDGKPALLECDANGDLTLWSRWGDYRGSFMIALLDRDCEGARSMAAILQ